MSDPATPKQTLGFVLNDVARLIRKLFEQRAKGLGLTRAQWQVLAYLRFYEGIRQGGLAELLELEPISLSRVVDKLEAAGLVERRPDAEDRRSKRLYLSPPALPMLEQLKIIAEGAKRDVVAGIPAEDQALMMQSLLTMRSNLVRLLGPDGIERGEEICADGSRRAGEKMERV